MRYFVTGATGYIGGVLARKLVANGHTVEALARSPEKADALAALGIRLHKGDVTELETMRAPMQGVDGVFHVAGWYKVGVRDTSMGQAINVDGTRNVLTLMKALGIPKGVYTSTLAINSDTGGRLVDESHRFTGHHLSEYDRTKAEAHHVANSFIQAGLPLVIVMPGLVYGEDDPSAIGALLRQYLQRALPLVPLKTAFCWAHVDDIADAHRLAMDKGRAGETYIIAGAPHTLLDALEMAARMTKIRVPRLRAAPAMMKAMAALMRPISRVAALPQHFHPETLRVSAGVTYLGDNAKARRELGYSPRPLETGLRPVLDYELRKLETTRKRQ